MYIGEEVTTDERAYLDQIGIDVYYKGTQEEWEAITIDNTDDMNSALTSSTIHYNAQ